MEQYDLARVAIAEKARSERLYLHYALALATLMSLCGVALIVLGLGNHMDILVSGDGGMEARFVNASPGVALWLIAGILFGASKPRKVVTTASHDHDRDTFSTVHSRLATGAPEDARVAIQEEVLRGANRLGQITRMSEDKLHATTDALVDVLRHEVRTMQQTGMMPSRTELRRTAGQATVEYHQNPPENFGQSSGEAGSLPRED